MAFALLTNTFDLSTTADATLNTLSWDRAEQGDASFFSQAEPTKIVIPSGVTVAELFFACFGTLSSNSIDVGARIYHNGTEIASQLHDDNGSVSFGFSTGLIAVSPGDEFTVGINFYGSGTKVALAAYTAFSIATPEREGIAAFYKSVSQTISTTETLLQWNGSMLDTHNSRYAPGGFKVPEGVTHAIVTVGIQPTSSDSDDVTYRLYQSGTILRQFFNRTTTWATGPMCFGIVPVTAGQILYVMMQNSGSIAFPGAENIDRITIEWLKPMALSYVTVGLRVYAVKRLVVTEVPSQQVMGLRRYVFTETP